VREERHRPRMPENNAMTVVIDSDGLNLNEKEQVDRDSDEDHNGEADIMEKITK
jgi:hypothetical protein